MWGRLLLLSIIPCISYSQITGEIRGTILDPAGALVPAAKVTLISTETTETRIFQTDGQGRFSLSLLKIGDYSLTVEARGFRKAITQVTVKSAEAITVSIHLDLGQPTEQVVVTGAVSPLDTQSAQAQESFGLKYIEELPLGRDPNGFPLSLPGVGAAPGGFNSGSFVTNGNRARANNITIDNISSTDVGVGGTGSANTAPLNFSSIKEVKVITNNFSAEFGRNSGAQVQYITQSGTNKYHGELYEYFRNDVLNARDWFDRTGAPSLTRFNEFGGVFGGPIRRNKTHFLLSAEVSPVRGLGGTRIAQVPTDDMVARVTDPTSKKLLDQYKIPTSSSGAVSQSASSFSDFYQYSARVDHQLSSRDSIYGRFGMASQDSTAPSIIFSGTNLANFGLTTVNKVYSANINETHAFSANLLNEFRAGFGRAAPIFNLLTTVPIGPRINFSNGEVANFGQTDGSPQGRAQTNYQVGDTVTYVKGAHNLKIGGDFYRYQSNSYQDTQVRGTYTFLNWDDFAQGRPNAYSQRFGSTYRGHRTWIGSAFVQDDYRIKQHLTLNLGFRLEAYGAISEVNNLVSNLNFNCRDSLGLAGTGPLGCFTVGGNAINGNQYPQPRIGFAWNPHGGKFVVRGGYGLVSDFNFLNPIVNQRGLPPFVVTGTLSGVNNFTGANTWANLVAGTAAIQQQNRALVGSIRNDVRNYGDVTPVLDPDLKNPQVHQWSLGVERQLPYEVVLKLSYQGVKGNFLQRLRPINLNANPPAAAVSLADEAARTQEFVSSYAGMNGAIDRFGSRIDRRFNNINYNDNSANSNFHAFELLASRPFRAGLSMMVAYTFSKSIDDVSDALSSLPNDNVLIQDPRNTRANRGLSAFDVAQRFIVTHVWEPRFLHGFGMSGISSWRSGMPTSFEAGTRLGVANISTIVTGGLVRPNAAGPIAFDPQPAGSAAARQGLTNDPVAGRRISAYADSLGLSQPLLGNFGTLGRSIVRLNGMTNFDWNVYKSFHIGERFHLKIRCEMYNVFNQHSFLNIDRNIASATFGQYTTLAQFQRTLQLGAVLKW